MRMAIDSIAPAPPRIRSSVRAPSAGSVRFCVATAPTSCSAKMQRAPAAGEAETTAAPNIPVRLQRATSE